jgi:hypothetical protein
VPGVPGLAGRDDGAPPGVARVMIYDLTPEEARIVDTYRKNMKFYAENPDDYRSKLHRALLKLDEVKFPMYAALK